MNRSGEPSRKATLRLSLSHDDDQPKYSAKGGRGKNERGDNKRDRQKSPLDDDGSSLSGGRAVQIELPPGEQAQESEDVAPEKKATLGKWDAKWPRKSSSSSLSSRSDSAVGSASSKSTNSASSSNTGNDNPVLMAQDSLMMVNDKKLLPLEISAQGE
ncbi:unnamed protein product [Anisakis simplex]|uniref:Suppressor protein SRP40-like n=1 Tax=Anisakis simplex TaxID=6269 RepID=A0A0M3J8P6_ANISI|nr:unnamed protein product [Anisakis simplex]